MVSGAIPKAAVALLEVDGSMFGKSHSFVPPSTDHCQVEATTQSFEPTPLFEWIPGVPHEVP